MPANLKITFWPQLNSWLQYINKKSSHFNEIWYTTAHATLGARWPTINIFKIQEGGQLQYYNLLNRHLNEKSQMLMHYSIFGTQW